MLIIGYLDQIHQWRVKIPDFHTGHLGLIPGTKVYCLGPVADAPVNIEESRDPSSAELVITPFSPSQMMYRVTCQFVEERGVVRRFVSVLSDLGINILSLESASINRGMHHVISATIDLSLSSLRDLIGPVPEDKIIQFRHLLWCLHADDYIAFDLALRLIQDCCDIVSWSRRRTQGATVLLPDISIQPLIGAIGGPELLAANRRELVIDRGRLNCSSPRNSTLVTLPKDTVQRIRDEIREYTDAPLHYIMISETNSRSLRLKFINAKRTKNLFQVGFRTTDEVGALHAITEALAQTRFNVLVSLTRKINDAESVWEAVLEYQGQLQMAREIGMEQRDLANQMEFVKEHLESDQVLWRSGASRFKVHMFTPSHIPELVKVSRRKGRLAIDGAVPLRLHERAPNSQDHDCLSRADRQRAATRLAQSQQRAILNYAATFPRRERVFISYSTRETELKKCLQEMLEKPHDGGPPEWIVETYEGNTDRNEAVDRAVRHRILQSDLFVGIWSAELGTDTQISPWLLYELGVAKAYEKPIFLIASTALSNRVFDVYPAIGRLQFSNQLEFRDLVADKLLPRLRRERELSETAHRA